MAWTVHDGLRAGSFDGNWLCSPPIFSTLPVFERPSTCPFLKFKRGLVERPVRVKVGVGVFSVQPQMPRAGDQGGEDRIADEKIGDPSVAGT
jgi:hypothetical protein